MTEYVTKDTIYVLLLRVFLKYPSRHRSRTCFFFLCVVLALLFTIQNCGSVLKFCHLERWASVVVPYSGALIFPLIFPSFSNVLKLIFNGQKLCFPETIRE